MSKNLKPMVVESVLENIKRLRKQKGFSHENIALELNISQAAYSKLEKNETKLTVERLYKIAEVLDEEVSVLLGVKLANQFNQTNKENTTGYLQQTANFYQENKEQNEHIIELYKARIEDKELLLKQKDIIIKKLENLLS